jgi:hypothetical protein
VRPQVDEAPPATGRYDHPSVSREVWSASVPDQFEAAMPEPPSPERVPKVDGACRARFRHVLGLVLRSVLERHQPREQTRRILALAACLREERDRLSVIGTRCPLTDASAQIASHALIPACTARLVAASE